MSEIQIVATPSGARAPFRIDAEVLEEDTYRVLSAPRVAKATPEPPRRLLTKARRSVPRAPGTALLQAGSPPRILAIVHDLERVPSWTEAWVREALEAALELAAAQGMAAVATDMVGTRYGSLEPVRFVELLRDVVAAKEGTGIERLWLRLPTAPDAGLAAAIRELGWSLDDPTDVEGSS